MGGVLRWVTGIVGLEVTGGPSEGSSAVERLKVVREASSLHSDHLERTYEARHLVLMIFSQNKLPLLIWSKVGFLAFLDPGRFFFPDASEGLAVEFLEVTGYGSCRFDVVKGVLTRKTGLHQKR